MKELNQLKEMLDNMQRRRLGVQKQIAEFKVLQGEIAGLYARAESDPLALSKLQKLDAVMNGGERKLHQPVIEKVAEAKKVFTQLGRQIKQLLPEQQESIDVAPQPEKVVATRAPIAKKHRRSFV